MSAKKKGPFRVETGNQGFEGPQSNYRAYEYFAGFIVRGGARTVAVPPYNAREVGTLLGLSAATVRKYVQHDPGVLRVSGGPGGRVSLRIPEEAVLRLKARLSAFQGNPGQSVVPARVPGRVKLLRNANVRVA